MRLCSFGNDPRRSWTDIFTNHTFISSIQEDLHPAHFLEGMLPKACLQEFLHEACHHWSLLSPVGTALAVVEHRARAALDDDPSAARAACVGHYRRLQIALALYRPLLEGLSLFAEFDATPSHSKISSVPMRQALVLFLSQQLSKDRDPFSDLFGLLSEQRRIKPTVDRKAALLASPFNSADGYLAGYLYVKAFSVLAGQTTRLGSDTDLVLGFVHNFFFHDYGLVDLLLQPLAPDGDAMLAERMMTRLAALFRIEDLQRAFETFERQCLDIGDADFEADPTGIERDPCPAGVVEASAERGKSRLRELLDESDPRLRAIRLMLAQRPIVQLGSRAVRVVIKRNLFTVFAEDAPLLAGSPRVQWTGPKENSGSVEFFYDARFEVVGIAVSVGKTLIGYALKGVHSELLEKQFGEYLISHNARKQESETAARRIAESLTAWSAKDRLQRFNEGLIKQALRSYAQIGLVWVSPVNRDKCAGLIGDNGFLGVYDERLMTSLAVLSLLDGLAIHLEECGAGDGSQDFVADCVEIERLSDDAFGARPLLRVRESGSERAGTTRILAFV